MRVRLRPTGEAKADRADSAGPPRPQEGACSFAKRRGDLEGLETGE